MVGEEPDEGGKVVVTTRVATSGSEDSGTFAIGAEQRKGYFTAVAVADFGQGLAVEDIPRAFEPFFSTKFTGRGLGLPAALGIVQGHQGFIEVKSELGRGCQVEAFLPAAEDA